MTLFRESGWQPTRRLSAELAAYFRGVLQTHANVPATGRCAVCRVARCPDWRHAYDQLAVAGEVMAEPERWQPAEDARSRR
jgi:hypothetical protein